MEGGTKEELQKHACDQLSAIITILQSEERVENQFHQSHCDYNVTGWDATLPEGSLLGDKGQQKTLVNTQERPSFPLFK